MIEHLGVAPRPGLIPNPLLRAIVGAFLKVLYTRVQGGAQRQLPGLIPHMVRWSFSYLPLPPTMDAIRDGRPVDWSADEAAFNARREKYLLYR